MVDNLNIKLIHYQYIENKNFIFNIYHIIIQIL